MAGIIKAGKTEELRSGPSPVAYRLDDISDRAQQHLTEARQQAEQIVEQAKADASRIERQAEVQGQRQALVQARQSLSGELQQHLQTLLPAFQNAITELAKLRVSWRNRWEQNTIKLAVAIAEKVIRREVEQQPEITTDLVQEALGLATGSERVVLRLHPHDLAGIESMSADLRNRFQSIGQLEIVADESIEEGSCRLTTDYGSIDQQFSVQLARIQEELSCHTNQQKDGSE